MAERGSDLLRIGRLFRGLTQTEVADVYGVNVKTYRRWEKGQVPVKHDDLTAIFGDVFKLPVEKFNGAATNAA